MNHSLLLWIFLSITLPLGAQEAVLSSGQDLSGAGGTVSYSVGQVVYTTNSNTNGTVSQGVQQTYDVSVTYLHESIEQQSFSVYPNPVSNNLMLNSELKEQSGLSYDLHGINGALIDRSSINNNAQPINMESLESSTYILTIKMNNTPIQTFTIIKD